MRLTIDRNPKPEGVSSFAITVTIQTQIGEGWIAKNGEDSLFKIFQQLFPQVGFNLSGALLVALSDLCIS